MITFESKGEFTKLGRYLEKLREIIKLGILDKYGKMGVEALKLATPKDTGKTAESWYYDIEHKKNYDAIVWKNSNRNDGVLIAVLIQYGHGTPQGAYIEGIDYINPAMRPLFDKITDGVWKEVSSL